jgi:hypothetical protein
LRTCYPFNLTCPIPPTPLNEPFKFSSPHGWQVCRKIITDKLPHDYQLEGITQALDGQDVVAVSATGSGKSVYIYMLAIILLKLANNPLLSPRCWGIGIFIVRTLFGLASG